MENMFIELANGLAAFHKTLLSHGLDPTFVEELTRAALREMLEAVKMMIEKSKP